LELKDTAARAATAALHFIIIYNPVLAVDVLLVNTDANEAESGEVCGEEPTRGHPSTEQQEVAMMQCCGREKRSLKAKSKANGRRAHVWALKGGENRF